MVPIPQYPLYSAFIKLWNGECLGYYLDEKNGWIATVNKMEECWQEAKKKGFTPKGLVLISPSNPTGKVMEEEDMKEIIRWAYKRNVISSCHITN